MCATLTWLLSIADERKNKKLYDCITLLNKRFKTHQKLINDLMKMEHKAKYYEMMYQSLVLVEKENQIFFFFYMYVSILSLTKITF